jgi:hypothetical protein
MTPQEKVRETAAAEGDISELRQALGFDIR